MSADTWHLAYERHLTPSWLGDFERCLAWCGWSGGIGQRLTMKEAKQLIGTSGNLCARRDPKSRTM